MQIKSKKVTQSCILFHLSCDKMKTEDKNKVSNTFKEPRSSCVSILCLEIDLELLQTSSKRVHYP